MKLYKAILCGILVLLLASCSYQAVEIKQEQGSSLAGELLDGHSFGQTFTSLNDGLSRIDLYTATYARENTHPVVFVICDSPGCEDGVDLLRLEIPADQISNSGPTVISFPPLVDTAGKMLYFSIESPGSIRGDAITVYMEEGDVYSGGQMYLDGEPTESDMAFIAYTRESFTLGDIWDDFYSRASQDQPFLTFYCTLMMVLLMALIVTLVWSAGRRRTDGSSIQENPDTKEQE